MSDEGGIFIIGVIIGIIVCGLIIHGISQGDLNDCAEQNNIYQCKWVAVPVETDQ